MQYRLLPDEFEILKQKELSLLERYKDAWKLAGEALQQSSETWHDNAPLDVARQTGELASKKLREVQDILSSSTIVDRIPIHPQTVSIGAKVTFSIDGDNEQSYIIGGYQTEIPWRVSYNAPIIRPLIGKRVGDIIENVPMGNRQVEIEIIDISVGITL